MRFYHITAMKESMYPIFGALIIGFAPLLVKATDLGPSSIGFYRLLFAFPIVLWFSRQKGKSLLKIPHGMALLAGLAFALDLYVWNRSIVIIGAGLATVLGNTQVFYLALLALFRHEEAPSWRFFLAIFIGFSGVTLIALDLEAVANQPDYMLGVFYGLATGFFYASYIVALKNFDSASTEISPGLRLGWSSFYGSCILFVICLCEGATLAIPSSMDLSFLLLLGVVCQGGGWFFVTSGIKFLGSARVGVILLIQPVTATVAAWLLFSEDLNLQQWLGLAMTLGGVYLGIKKPK